MQGKTGSPPRPVCSWPAERLINRAWIGAHHLRPPLSASRRAAWTSSSPIRRSWWQTLKVKSPCFAAVAGRGGSDHCCRPRRELLEIAEEAIRHLLALQPLPSSRARTAQTGSSEKLTSLATGPIPVSRWRGMVGQGAEAPVTGRGQEVRFNASRFAVPHHPGGLRWRPSARLPIHDHRHMAAGGPGRAGPVTARIALPGAPWDQSVVAHGSDFMRGIGRVLRHATPVGRGTHRSMAWLGRWVSELANRQGFAESDHAPAAGDRSRRPGAPDRAKRQGCRFLFGDDECTGSGQSRCGGCPSPQDGRVAHNGQSPGAKQGRINPAERMPVCP